MTGFSPATRQIMLDRSEGCCERCCSGNPTDAHHRRARGAGGSKDPLTNTPANGVILCRDCHLRTESRRAESLEQGWLVRQGHDPSIVPVFYRQWRWALLDESGGIDYLDDYQGN